ncbi:ATP-dependent helicase Fun30p [Trichomonascus vanleenenianus]|uniref:DNA-dependent ATPase FUN30 n=1 Tax=Trichomonascus vanleenenianus TaxID=2268995 RepID=UPI003ECB0F80
MDSFNPLKRSGEESESDQTSSKRVTPNSSGTTTPTGSYGVKVQVPATPSPLKKPSGQKRPTSLFRRGTDLNSDGNGRLPSLEKFAYKPPQTQPRIISSGVSGGGGGGSTVFSRYKSMLDGKSKPAAQAAPQSGPSVALPASASSGSGSALYTGLQPDQLKVYEQLKRVFKDVSEPVLVAAAKMYPTFNTAASYLVKRQHAARNKTSSQPESQHVPQQVELTIPSSSASSKRIVTKTHTIRQKFGTAGNTRLEYRDDEDEDEMSLIKPPPGRRNRASREASPASFREETAEPIRRRLVRAHLDEEEAQYSDDSDAEGDYEQADEAEFEQRLLEFINTASVEDIADISACPEDQVDAIIKNRPYESLDDAREVEVKTAAEEAGNGKPKRRGRRQAAGEKVVYACSTTLRGYEAVDSLIQKCEELGQEVAKGISQWGVDIKGGDSEISLTNVGSDEDEDNEEVKKTSSTRRGGYFKEKPKLLAEDLVLKSYQQVGINWLSLLYNRGLSCILADEMGLGKTCQVISFLAHLQEKGIKGPHLIVVPSSTLENWLREFKKFCPVLKIEPYYGSQNERAEIREALSQPDAPHYDVMVTTYNLACGGKADIGFLKSRQFNVCVYDEGHLLKNSQSERYAKLMKIKAKFRLLLTGTPLQNNLKELVSLLSFILPGLFSELKDELAGIFKHRAKATDDGNGSSRNPLLSEQRITKAKTMMTPFVLRRRKEQVLQHLPPKTHRVEYCDLVERQKELYDEELETSRKNTEARAAGDRAAPLTNVLMQLRKAAIHPLLFRRLYDDETLRAMAKEIMQEPQYVNNNEDYIFEDMTVMNDYELHNLCLNFPSTLGHRQLSEEMFLSSGKVQKLCEMLPKMKANGDRVLLFSQFTQMLDILEKVLSKLDIEFIRMDGQTGVDVRQDMIDTFYEEKNITVFLLSTKAGGFGINLACANTVIIHDLSFNPHDDKQAEDRAHRVGQTQTVNVVRMISKGTIEENILALANTKLALDASVSDEKEAEKAESNNASLIAHELFDNK